MFGASLAAASYESHSIAIRGEFACSTDFDSFAPGGATGNAAGIGIAVESFLETTRLDCAAVADFLDWLRTRPSVRKKYCRVHIVAIAKFLPVCFVIFRFAASDRHKK